MDNKPHSKGILLGVAWGLCALWAPETVFSHGGGVDGRGCHLEQKTGIVHCHRKAGLSGTAKVVDGDTLVISGKRIRLFGIDAPEKRQLCRREKRPWPCGREAAKRLEQKIAGATLSCTKKALDRFGRIVAVCRTAELDINQWMVEQGLALVNQKYSKRYLDFENVAKRNRRGVWASQFEKPWDWRRQKR